MMLVRAYSIFPCFFENLHFLHQILCKSCTLIVIFTHRDRDEMASILQTTSSKQFFLKETNFILIQIAVNQFSRAKLTVKPAFVKILAWHRRDNKPLSKPTKDDLIYWSIYASPSLNRLRLFINLLSVTVHNFMMTSSNENIFRVIGPLCGEFASNWWNTPAKASDFELWSFLWFAPE